jgi:hypothetical protein
MLESPFIMKANIIVVKNLVIVLVLTLAAFGCAKKAQKAGPGQVTQQQSTVKFYGHKVTVFVDASPEELIDKYLTDPDKLKQELGNIKIERVSGSKFARLGDRADYEIKAGGISVPYRMTMIHFQPNEEIWYMTETMGDLVVSVLRYQMKRVKGGTVLTVRFELEEPQSAFMKSFAEIINFQTSIIKGTEHGTAMIQAYFNKKLSVDELMEHGLRGESYVTFFSVNDFSAHVNAPTPKVHKYLTSPDTWAKWEKEYKVVNFGPCLTMPQTGSCLALVNIMGVDYKLEFFSADYQAGKYTASYFTMPVIGVGRFQTLLKPREQGTDLNINYMVQLSQGSPAATEFLINFSQLPKTVEEMVLDIKRNSEKP